MKSAMTAFILVVLCGAALADEVRLTQGRSLVGIARREESRVVVETRHGTITVPASDVASVTPGRTALHEYRERLAALGSSPDAAKVYALSIWAREQGLIRYVAALQQWTIALDPDHREARADLDYVQYQGRWVPRQDRDADQSGRRTQVQKQQPRPATTAKVRPSRPQPEMSPGYVYLGIPPSLPARGSQNHDTGGLYLAVPVTTPLGIR
jgi:hypothetical protein